ncbi:small GTP-binding protein, putative [Trichomonas vaginalis G3]|uniref:Small GTP-binding protein, putative n=1 Tax=Trichomonas vaginalis (strain ATCC PRA-98 / G3) TaxID=412133 RepID=A2E312_TRIV3|nr:GTPase protein [Trichomonas vaginalis G3]EAY12948.1 small GTP-binding protein, putative [Trichomonas vaginalis G3]KAI5499760.1 GTPase protein [Trichomonas vaginalis G3]|eukprot:XP_001325171.1 small GTP-binding protein [Trichomonas vaginalis G3]
MTTSSTPTVKVIFVGSSSVGKTCLIGALFHQDFNPQPVPTVAPAFNVVDITQKSGRMITLQVWDTAGQERYSAVNLLFYRDADVACVCYDPGNPEFKESVPAWIKSVLEEVPTCKLFLILTKLDLYDEQKISEFKADANLFKEKFNIEEIFYTSAAAKTGFENLLQAAADTANIAPVMNAVALDAPPQEPKKGCC